MGKHQCQDALKATGKESSVEQGFLTYMKPVKEGKVKVCNIYRGRHC